MPGLERVFSMLATVPCTSGAYVDATAAAEET